MMIPRLPPELTDRIIDFVSGLDRHDFGGDWTRRNRMLCSCALTCRAWLPASRFHLYSDRIFLNSHKRFEALVRASRIPHISTALRSVPSIMLVDEEPERAWVHRFILTLGHTFADIEELDIWRIKWNKVIINPAIQSSGLAQFRCVVKLSLYFSAFRTFRQFQCIVCAFPQLRDLTVHNLIAPPSRPTFAPALRLPPLTRLHLRLDIHERMKYYLWFASVSSQLSLRTVLLHVDMQTLQDVGVILQTHARRLEDVTLFFQPDFPLSSPYGLNVHLCTALRELDLRNVKGISLAGVLDLISPESRIHTLRIKIQSAELDWEHASRMLEEECFCSLQQFHLIVQDNALYQDEKTQQHVDVTFDAVRRRGVSVDVEFQRTPSQRPPDAEHTQT